MKVLIIGGTSSLGVELKQHLSSMHNVTTAGRSNCDSYLDLSNSSSFEMSSKFDVVIMTVAVFGGDDFDSYEENININVSGTLRSIAIAQESKASRFILISSMSALQNLKSPFFGIYSITKRHAEEVAEYVCKSIGMPLTILRPSQLYGENLSFNKHQPLIYSIANSAFTNQDIVFYGRNNSLRNYLHVRDFNVIIEKVIDLQIDGNYNCVHVQNITVSMVAEAAINAFDSKSKYSFDDSKTDIVDNEFVCDVKFYQIIDFEPKISINRGMRMLAEYFNKREINE
jgi:nucleoside-diphosphate-sugar epimerase